MITRIAIASAIVLIAGLTVSLFVLRRIDGAYEIGQGMPLNIAYSIDGDPVPIPVRKCIVVRLTSDQCQYCKQDQAQYDRLASAAALQHCAAATIGPRYGDLEVPSTQGPPPIQYVDLPLARALMPFSVPQTLVADRDGRLVWQRVGVLNDQDVKSALAAVGRLR